MRCIRVYTHVAGGVTRKISVRTMSDRRNVDREQARLTIPPSIQGPRERKADDLIAPGQWRSRSSAADGPVNSTASPSARGRDAERRGILKRKAGRLSRTRIRVVSGIGRRGGLRSVPLTDLASRIASVTYIRECETRQNVSRSRGRAFEPLECGFTTGRRVAAPITFNSLRHGDRILLRRPRQ